MAFKGSNVLLKIGDGAPSESFTVLGGLQLTRMRLENELIEASHVDSGNYRKILPGTGITSLSITGEGIFNDSVSEETLRSQAFEGGTRNYRLEFANAGALIGPFYVVTYVRRGDHEGIESYSLTMESAGPISYSSA